MTLRTRRRRAAFTLIELMVVMGILAIMVTLLLSGVNRVRIAMKRGTVQTEISELSQGVGFFKQKFPVDYIPSRIVLRERLNYNFSDPLELASHNWLKEAWPHMAPQTVTNQSPFPPLVPPGVNGVHGIDWNQDGQITDPPVTLEGDQCLVFFLGGINEPYPGQTGKPSGFSTNKRNPMDPTPERIGPFIQFQVDRLVARATPAGVAGFRSYYDPWKTQPYAYFTSYGKTKGNNAYVAADCQTLGVVPYSSATGYLNKDGFQIISAGEDKAFGTTGTMPAPGVGEDDVANFTQGTLGTPK